MLVVQQRLSVKQLKSIAENEHIPSFADSTTGCHQGLIANNKMPPYGVAFFVAISPAIFALRRGEFAMQAKLAHVSEIARGQLRANIISLLRSNNFATK